MSVFSAQAALEQAHVCAMPGFVVVVDVVVVVFACQGRLDEEVFVEGHLHRSCTRAGTLSHVIHGMAVIAGVGGGFFRWCLLLFCRHIVEHISLWFAKFGSSAG